MDDSDVLTVLVGGDVMLGRGVDQILPHPGDPALREPVVRDARRYVELAEHVNGPIRRPVDWGWPWGDAAEVLAEVAPDVRLINLETTITVSGDFADRKAVHYRMHPDNMPALTAIAPDVCALANNHVLDFGHRGLADTCESLAAARIKGVGAGAGLEAAQRLSVLTPRAGHRVIIGSVATRSSGVPDSWAAHRDRPGLWLIRDPAERGSADDLAARVLALKRTGDVAIVSVHWGSNWGYGVGLSEVQFAHRLIDAGIDIVHGHSSHHPRPIELYRGKPILYGCGDVIDDYEGIGGHESYRPDLRLLYLISIDCGSGDVTALRMLPLRVRRMRLERASAIDTDWLRATMEHVSRRFDISVAAEPDGLLTVHLDAVQDCL
ncbi:putative enzyme of poly-gamma-glutamate biosynthesis (capsule formation) [Mycolicibacterium chubuense NBB4]|uniref:Putative enzyme of poly-gamma-glutamate biosynthesis (Capsule formation) n=1 Tax=Mycolicibacterium chubuense (strain NBB4) TaxID=710421 RepID=I4BL54_MYCCN|nr:putative enzyme of poly-gamma-glutamate biosynthesis (capsule formation) [Mycolicibacterium chubuense NBB4]